jgi:hypothetical protein
MHRPLCHDHMTYDEARAVILFHGTGATPSDVGWEKQMEVWEDGFLGSLRRFRGTLDERNFHEVIQAIEIVAPHLHEEKVDRELMSSLWAITYLGWLWGLAPDRMLQRNNLISSEDTERLHDWISEIGMKVYLCFYRETLNHE